jgi:predicted amidohydrolase YtcJ
VIDLQGRLAVPGFIEGHGHLMWLGDSKAQLDLSRAESWDDAVALVAEAARKTPRGEWIRGMGWHQAKWKQPPKDTVKGFPLHEALSAVSKDHPVILKHASGHGAFANAKAMEQRGVTAGTKDPPGGEIVRDARGRPTGMFLENAQSLVDPEPRAANAGLLELITQFPGGEAQTRRRALLAAEEALSKGVTTFHDAGASFETIDVLKKMAEAGEMPLRLFVMIAEPNDALAKRLAEYKIVGAGEHHLTVRAVKRVMDGALGSRGAWLLEPYTDLKSSTGLNTETPESIGLTARLAADQGFQLCVHAIGDRANREVLDLFEKAFETPAGRRDARWRIEHAQHLHPLDIPRFARLGVIASMQGVHPTSDAPFVAARLGETRAREGAYAWRSLLDAGAIVTNGTDTPVEDIDPIRTFYASVTRQPLQGPAFYPEQRMTRAEALRSYTWNNAYAAFEEDLKGSLAVGKLADVTVLSRDIMTVQEAKIPGTRVDYTIVGGKVLYSAPPAPSEKDSRE